MNKNSGQSCRSYEILFIHLPHLLSLCENKFLKGSNIARHNTTIHQLTSLFKSLITQGTSQSLMHEQQQHARRQQYPIMDTTLHLQHPKIYVCSQTTTRHHFYPRSCTRANQPTNPNHNFCIQMIEFTFTHDRCIQQATKTKYDKYHPLIEVIKT